MKKKQAAEKPDRHKKKGKTKPGLTFVERRRLAELKHMLAGTNKNAEKPTTAQKTITFQKMYRDGICQVTSGFYTKMVEFYDINYDLLEIEDKGEILEEYSRLINYFDPSIKFELFLFNRQVNEQTLIDQFDIPLQADDFDDIRDLGNQLKELGMLIVQDAVWNRVSQNRERKIATRYYCDEFHLLLKEKQTAIYSVEIWKRFRKWGGIPTGLTQNVGDFLKSEEIEGILGNSDFVYLLNQNAKDQAILADKLGLSEKQLAHVTNSEPGCGLILFDNVVIPFVDKYPVDTKTFAVMNTKPEESVRQEVNE